MLPGLRSAAQPEQTHPTEYQIKAAYLYNFGKFVRWRDASSLSPGSAFPICVLGKDPFDGALEATVAGQTIGGNPISVKKVNSVAGVAGCKLLYVNADETKRFRSIMDTVRRLPILTVSDAPDFLDNGGIIQFVVISKRVRFEVNLNAARDAGVQLSAELLKVATRVVGNNVMSKEQF
jgi:hypothetical protein